MKAVVFFLFREERVILTDCDIVSKVCCSIKKGKPLSPCRHGYLRLMSRLELRRWLSYAVLVGIRSSTVCR